MTAEREREAFLRLVERSGVAPGASGWHEPDECGLSARVLGSKLDNAFGAHITTDALLQGYQEIVVMLTHTSEDGSMNVYLNLATLLGDYHALLQEHNKRQARYTWTELEATS